MTDLLLLAFIFLIAAIVVVPVAARFGLGSVLGYLIAGVLISPLLGFLHVDVMAIQHVAEFGVVIMLFLIGLELDPKTLWSLRMRILGLGGGQVILTTLVITIACLMLDIRWSYALAAGLILSLSSTAIVLQTLNEKGWTRSEGGQASFSVLLFQDIAVIPMLAFMPLLASPELVATISSANGGGESELVGDHGESLSLVEGLPTWLALIVTSAAVGAVVIAGQFLARPIFRFIAATRVHELFTAVALMIVVGIALLMSLVGLSPALGTFIAGVVLANNEYRHELEANIEPFRGLLLGLFFITVGAGMDFGLLVSDFRNIIAVTFGVMAAKVVILYLLCFAFRPRGAQHWLVALGLSQMGEFGFVLLAFTDAQGILPDEMSDHLLLSITLSMLITPLVFLMWEKLIAPIFSRKQADREADEIEETHKIIIAGRGRVGGIVDNLLTALGHQATVIDYNSGHLNILKTFGVHAYYGDATRPDLLRAAGIEDASILVVTLDGKEQINTLVKHVLETYPHVHIVARAVDREHVYQLWSLGCRDIIRETFDSSVRIGRSVLIAMGTSPEKAQRISDAFTELDKKSLRRTAAVYDLFTPSHKNDEFIRVVREIRNQFGPALKDKLSDDLKDD
ncbi:cation:proton antiporter domain-containing protein [Ponticaulis profundi]|uniref:Cation:proton antiporter n=1 Tax=Ponticaulis profundi TaxID=2665222 RepID=A0ABW1SAR7_9PROT